MSSGASPHQWCAAAPAHFGQCNKFLLGEGDSQCLLQAREIVPEEECVQSVATAIRRRQDMKHLMTTALGRSRRGIDLGEAVLHAPESHHEIEAPVRTAHSKSRIVLIRQRSIGGLRSRLTEPLETVRNISRDATSLAVKSNSSLLRYARQHMLPTLVQEDPVSRCLDDPVSLGWGKRYDAPMARPPSSPRTEADQVQVKLFKEASPAKRFARCRSLSSSVVMLARRAIRNQNPSMTDEEVGLEFVSLHYGPELAAKLLNDLENR